MALADTVACFNNAPSSLRLLDFLCTCQHGFIVDQSSYYLSFRLSSGIVLFCLFCLFVCFEIGSHVASAGLALGM